MELLLHVMFDVSRDHFFKCVTIVCLCGMGKHLSGGQTKDLFVEFFSIASSFGSQGKNLGPSQASSASALPTELS